MTQSLQFHMEPAYLNTAPSSGERFKLTPPTTFRRGMTDDTDETSWGIIGIIIAGLSAVLFTLAQDMDGELELVLRGAGVILLVGGLLLMYRS